MNDRTAAWLYSLVAIMYAVLAAIRWSRVRSLVDVELVGVYSRNGNGETVVDIDVETAEEPHKP